MYTITTQKSGPGKKPLVRLTGVGWPREMGIDHIQFTSQRAAAYFAQHHAAGRPATLRLLTDGFLCGDRPIPAIGDLAVPACHEDSGEDFFQFFLSWPVSLKDERRKFVEARQTQPPQQRLSKVAEHPAAWRWTPADKTNVTQSDAGI